MHNMSSNQNIPTDIIRTVVAIAETGSLTQAAKKLGISQPAATSQVKRIQEILGGSLFVKTSNGSTPTDFGRLFLEHARRMLDANDQMLRLSGLSQRPQPVRLGISSVFLSDFLANEDVRSVSGVTVQIDSCVGLAKSLVDAQIDVACILDNPKLESDVFNFVVDECREDMAWVRSPDFQLSPGKPLPVLIWPGDGFMINALTQHGLSFNVIFNSTDYHSKLKAAAAGFGITAMLRRLIPSNLIAADDYDYLPKLPAIRSMLCARPNLSSQARCVIDRISEGYFHDNRTAPQNASRGVADDKPVRKLVSANSSQ